MTNLQILLTVLASVGVSLILVVLLDKIEELFEFLEINGYNPF